jgi:hypothetical protein
MHTKTIHRKKIKKKSITATKNTTIEPKERNYKGQRRLAGNTLARDKC